jgi:hypothetical protein
MVALLNKLSAQKNFLKERLNSFLLSARKTTRLGDFAD